MKMGKVSADRTNTKIDNLTRVVTHGFAGMGRGFAAIADDIADIKSSMATKDDVRDIVAAETKPIWEELKRIREELKDIRKQLDMLEEASKSHAGFSKEVDHILQRVIAIERRLGIKT